MSSVPELELRAFRTREALSDTVRRIRRRSNVPARWRELVETSREQLYRDPTPIVAMGATIGVGIAAIVLGVSTARHPASSLAAADTPMLLPAFTPAKTKKDGTPGSAPKFARVPDKQNPVAESKRRARRGRGTR
ncbi:hypothetical protein [Curtobacterium ammoniigenes]|uniref:hypothetical protein n=1 Tax=Curtobacterium ammoniigenes TaxID=395387 RepID=UPI00082C239A|nr:hypothetical protein [Curtobacterium ammoniigenes]